MPPGAEKPPVKRKFGKYGNPFKLSAEQQRHADRQRYEAMAHFIKGRTGDKRPLKEIAADLSRAEMRQKK